MKNNILKLRTERGLSQVRLGDLVGTTGPQINRLEKGERKLTVEWIERLAKAFQVSPVEIVSFRASPPTPSTADLVAKAISLACSKAINELLREKKISLQKADAALEKAIWHFWDDFVKSKQPTIEQIKKYMIKIS